jgi:pyruvyl transferase EpsO
LACFVVAESLFQYFSAVYQSLAQQKSLTQIMVIQWAGRLLLLWIALYADHHLSLDEALRMMALTEMLSIIALIWVQRWHIKHIPKRPSHTATLWPDWQAIRHMALHNYGFILLAAPPQGYFVKMLAAIFLPTHMVAAYGFFVSLAEKARQYIPLHFFYNLIEPVMVGNYLQHKDFNKLTKYCQWLYKSNLLILVPAIVWITVAGSHLVDLLTAGKYHSYVWILLLVTVQLTIGSHVMLLQLLLNAINKSAWLMRAGVYALFGLLLFWFVAVPMHATALLFGPLLFSLICNIYIIRKLNHSGYAYGLTWQVFTGVLVAGLAALLVALLVNQQWFTENSNDIWVTALAGLVVLSVYLLAVYVLKLISQEEWLFLKSFKQKKTV